MGYGCRTMKLTTQQSTHNNLKNVVVVQNRNKLAAQLVNITERCNGEGNTNILSRGLWSLEKITFNPIITVYKAIQNYRLKMSMYTN